MPSRKKKQEGPSEIVWTYPQTRIVLDALATRIGNLPAGAALYAPLCELHETLRLMHIDAGTAEEWTLTLARKSRTYAQGKSDRERELAEMHPSDRQRIFDAYAEAQSKTPAAPAILIGAAQSDEHNGARVVLIARDYGWPGRDEETPNTNAIALAERDLAHKTLTALERDALAFRYSLIAEEWLNENAAAAGFSFGWKFGVFYYESAEWWMGNGGPDQMFL